MKCDASTVRRSHVCFFSLSYIWCSVSFVVEVFVTYIVPLLPFDFVDDIISRDSKRKMDNRFIVMTVMLVTIYNAY